MVGALRSDRPGKIIALVAVFVLAVSGTIYATLQLQGESASVANAIIVAAGSALTFAVAVGPFLAGVHDLLDPRRFTVFGLPPVPLAFSVLFASLVGLPSLALIAAVIAVSAVWTAHGTPVLVAIVGGVVAVLTCVVASRVSMLAARLWRRHGSRELTGLLMLVGVVIVVPSLIFVASLQWEGIAPPALTEAAAIVSFTPFGAAWAFPGLIAEGAGSAVVVLLIALATLAALVWVWVRLVKRAFATIERPLADRERSGMGWFALLPSTPLGAIAARSLVYWLRDKRYFVNLAIVPVGAIAASLPLLIAGVPLQIVVLIPVALMALFFGWSPHNDIAYDSTAIWMHVVAGVRGLADRLGRLVPIVVISVPVLAIVIAIASAMYGDWRILPALVGVSANLFLAGLGLSSVSSVLAPYAATKPGDSPFQQPQRGGSGFGAQAVVLVGTILLSLQTILLGFDVATVDIEGSNAVLWVGLAWGIGVLAVGVAVGAALWNRRSSRIMEFAETN